MSSKALIFVLGVVILAFAAYVFQDRIPSPSVSAKRPYNAPNEHKVAPLETSPEAFEVLDHPGAAGRDYFCAAAMYAVVVLRADPADHVRVTHALGPSQTRDSRRAVGFELVPAAQLPNAPYAGPLTPGVDTVGESRSVRVARRFCAI